MKTCYIATCITAEHTRKVFSTYANALVFIHSRPDEVWTIEEAEYYESNN